MIARHILSGVAGHNRKNFTGFYVGETHLDVGNDRAGWIGNGSDNRRLLAAGGKCEAKQKEPEERDAKLARVQCECANGRRIRKATVHRAHPKVK